MTHEEAARLNDERAIALARMETLHAKSNLEDRDLTPDEDHEFQECSLKIHGIDRRFDREGVDSGAGLADFRSHSSAPAWGSETRETATAGRTPEGGVHARSARDVFGAPQHSSDYSSDDEYLRCYLSGRYDDRLTRATDGVAEALPSSGGFFIKDTMAFTLWDRFFKGSDFAPLCQSFAVPSGSLQVPCWDDQDRSGGTRFGGLNATWVAEEGTITKTKPKARRIELNPRGLKLLTAVSNEWLSNSEATAELVQSAMSATMTSALNEAILTGDGAGKPQGVLNAPCTVTVAKAEGQANGSVLYENVTTMFARMLPSCRQNAVWVATNDLVPELLSLTITIGTAGDHVPAVNESNGQFRLLGRPVVFSEHAPQAGEKGDLMFCDFSAYALAVRRHVEIASSPGPYFDSDQLAIRAVCYIDGQSMFSQANAPRKGTLALSPFVALGERKA